MRLTLIIPLVAVALVLSGCPKTAYHDAVVAEHDFKLGVQSFQQAELAEFQAGRISQAEHQTLENGIAQVGTAAQTLVTALQGGVVNTTVQQDFATVSTAITTLLNDGVLGLKNPTSQALLKTILQTAQAILANVGTLLSQPATATAAVATKGGL